jgi:hypothetical protein
MKCKLKFDLWIRNYGCLSPRHGRLPPPINYIGSTGKTRGGAQHLRKGRRMGKVARYVWAAALATAVGGAEKHETLAVASELSDTTIAAKLRRKEEVEARIRELEEKKRQSQQQMRQERRDCIPQKLEDVIARYEMLFERCAVRKSDRCADVMYTLGSLYYDKARREYAANQGGNISDNAKATDIYQQLIREYPNFEKIPKAKEMLDTLLQLQNK